MKISKIRISKFRGINFASILLPDQGVFIGDNNTGKSTIFEALDLILGPDRLSRRYPINEHDFYKGEYINSEEGKLNPQIKLEATVTSLDAEQARRFRDYLEFWDTQNDKLIVAPPVAAIEDETVTKAIRVTFIGKYNEEEDDFEGKTYFSRSLKEGLEEDFTKSHKRLCGFLYLRTLRTGSRALSLEHGSLLDIILRIKEIRPEMWESIITPLKDEEVAAAPEIGISDILDGVQAALKKYVPDEWGTAPRLKVSNLTRENLRKVITAFVTDPASGASIPYYRQGTGTINMLVLSMLTMIADGKSGKVIFAMEEPETAIPPYTQKRIVSEVKKLSSQALFTSHSPYVIEEFTTEETIVLDKKKNGRMRRQYIELPVNFRLKKYRQNFRQRFCECLLSRRLVVCEGVTEETALVSAARRLSELNPTTYSSLEALGIAAFDADGETEIWKFAKMFKALGKATFGLCDLQNNAKKALILPHVDELFMHGESSTEKVIILQAPMAAKARYLATLVATGNWKPHLVAIFPDPTQDVDNALARYLKDNKGNWAVSDFIAQCSEDEIPTFFKDTCKSLKALVEPVVVTAAQAAPVPAPPANV